MLIFSLLAGAWPWAHPTEAPSLATSSLLLRDPFPLREPPSQAAFPGFSSSRVSIAIGGGSCAGKSMEGNEASSCPGPADGWENRTILMVLMQVATPRLPQFTPSQARDKNVVGMHRSQGSAGQVLGDCMHPRATPTHTLLC